MMLPGVDVATAEAVLAAWGDVTRFPDGDHAASYLGLVPSPSSRRTAATTARSPSGETARPVGCLPRPPSISTSTLGRWAASSDVCCRKKNRNVAVVVRRPKDCLDRVADARHRRAVTATPIHGLPPTSSARLRVKVTGVRRKSGPAKGQKAMAKLPDGSPHEQGPRGGVPVGGCAPAAAAAARRAANGQASWL